MKLIRFKFAFDWTLVLVPVLLATGSIATLFSITSISGKTSLVYDQLVYFAISTAIYIFLSAMDYRLLKNIAWYGYFLGIFFLILVEFFGNSIFGSTRWISLGFFQFQPSELMKFLYIIFASAYFSEIEKIDWRKLLTFVIFTIIPAFLILKEPDLGTTLVLLASFLACLLAIKIPTKFYLVFIALALIASPLLWMNLKPYQRTRITSFMNPEADPKGAGYNVSQSKITVGSGGLYGKGFSGATQSQLQFLPVAHVDFIFSGWAEATGFVGSIFLVLAYCFLIFRLFAISLMSRDRFGYIFIMMVAGVMIFQVLVNIGMNIGLMPVTGIPLPLFSHGGTAVIVMSTMLALCQSIYLRRKPLSFD